MKRYYLNHRYRDFVIVPYVGIADNLSFCFDDDDKTLITSDSVEAEVIKVETKHFFQATEIIEKEYKMPAYEWLKSWYLANHSLNSLDVLLITLKRKNV